MHNIIDPTKNTQHTCTLPSVDPITIDNLTDLLLPTLHQQYTDDNFNAATQCSYLINDDLFHVDNNDNDAIDTYQQPQSIIDFAQDTHTDLTDYNTYNTDLFADIDSVKLENDISTLQKRRKLSITSSSPEYTSHSPIDETDKIHKQKQKHLQSDRDRRRKIRSGVDQLKALVIPNDIKNDKNIRIDQAKVVHASVTLITELKEQVAALQAQLQSQQSMEQQYNKLVQSPLYYAMPIFNAAAMAVWRVALADRRVLEVNSVFELLTGHKSADIVGKLPCAMPFSAQLCVVPNDMIKQVDKMIPNYKIYDDSEKSDNTEIPLTHDPADNKCTHGLPDPLSQHMMSLPSNRIVRVLFKCRRSDGSRLTAVSNMQLMRHANNTPAYFVNHITIRN